MVTGLREISWRKGEWVNGHHLKICRCQISCVFVWQLFAPPGIDTLKSKSLQNATLTIERVMSRRCFSIICPLHVKQKPFRLFTLPHSPRQSTIYILCFSVVESLTVLLLLCGVVRELANELTLLQDQV